MFALTSGLSFRGVSVFVRPGQFLKQPQDHLDVTVGKPACAAEEVLELLLMVLSRGLVWMVRALAPVARGPGVVGFAEEVGDAHAERRS